MSRLKIDRTPLKTRDASAIGSTLSRIRIEVLDRVVTQWASEFEEGGEAVEVPAYYLAEWIAENWWPLLWEPRKSEDLGDSPGFLLRHSAITAQHGFALPQLMFVAQGDQISVTSSARFVSFADCRFRNSAAAIVPRKDVESELRKFVEGIVKHLDLIGGNTDLQEEWRLVTSTSADEAQFCSLVGALGLSPYAVTDDLATTLESAGERHSFQILLDLCQSSTPEAVEASLALADKARELTATAPEAEFDALYRRSAPADNPAVPGWRHGVNAAKAARSALNIGDADPEGASKLFDLLKIDLAAGIQVPGASPNPASMVDTSESGTIVGAVERDENRSKIALLQQGLPQRRFSAARATYLAWTAATPQASRLLTTAVTRDQQASRAFAAEIMAPVRVIREKAGSRKLTQDNVYEIASRLGASPDVVRKQAQNNNILVGR